MKRSLIFFLAFICLLASPLVKGAGLTRTYTLPCGVNNYVIIPIANPLSVAPYTLYAADGITVVAGPQTSNVFANVPGNIGDHYVIAVKSRFNGADQFTTVTLNSGTSIMGGTINCACTLGPFFCSILANGDNITGMNYLWTDPVGHTYTGAGFSVPASSPDVNGTWTVSSNLTVGACTYNFSNSFLVTSCFVMPMTYKYVRASSVNCKIKTEWSTTQEQNTDRFEVEISADGSSDWQLAKSVAAAGNSSIERAYSTEIDPGGKNTVYVRLKQIDKDGRSLYSSIMQVNTNCKTISNYLTAVPNIIQQGSSVAIKIDNSGERGQARVVVTDISGRKVLTQMMAITGSSSQYNLSLSTLLKGTYFINVSGVQTNWQSNTVKLIVQ